MLEGAARCALWKRNDVLSVTNLSYWSSHTACSHGKSSSLKLGSQVACIKYNLWEASVNVCCLAKICAARCLFGTLTVFNANGLEKPRCRPSLPSSSVRASPGFLASAVLVVGTRLWTSRGTWQSGNLPPAALTARQSPTWFLRTPAL